jgi:hypothetical protein
MWQNFKTVMRSMRDIIIIIIISSSSSSSSSSSIFFIIVLTLYVCMLVSFASCSCLLHNLPLGCCRSGKPKLTAVGIRCADHATLYIR